MMRPAQSSGISIMNVLTAAAIGYFAWGEHTMALGLAVAIAYMWAQAPTRTQAGLIAFAYYLAVARGLPKGIAVFFGTQASMLSGVMFWALASALLAIPWTVFWSMGGNGYAWRLTTILAIVSLPPVGIIGWGNPLTAAGALFPHAGWLGLFATYALMLLLCHMARLRPVRGALCVCVVQTLLLFYGSSQNAPENDASVKGVDTELPGSGYGQYSGVQSYFNNLQLIALAREESVSTVLLPESVAGLWLDATASLWQSRKIRPERVFLGATEVLPDDRYNNVIVAVATDRSSIVYRQRMPVPIGMWHPWRPAGAVADWRRPGGFSLDGDGTRYGVLVCYEQLLLWPVLQTYAERPALILAPANAWWSQETSIPEIQKTVLRAWARLFDVPTVTAFNYF
jgi:hypothetical protein